MRMLWAVVCAVHAVSCAVLLYPNASVLSSRDYLKEICPRATTSCSAPAYTSTSYLETHAQPRRIEGHATVS